ncbi:polysaccharide pyruvyl transferase family protein [Blastopirellula sp. JC733]|nr:polysaccharide pyruvyl transferase family protein [Blastopirellula sediminis]
MAGRKVGLVDGVAANVGDRLIYAATRQLLDHFKVDWHIHDPYEPSDDDLLLLFGGGNLGSGYHAEVKRRQAAIAQRKPTIILPQSAYGQEAVCEAIVYLREPSGKRFFPEARLAPDMALAYLHAPFVPNRAGAFFLRQDSEGRFRTADWQSRSVGDPIQFARSPEDYVGLAGSYEYIVTDRLHFAIAAMMNGVPTTLIPNRTPKNRGMWETWLGDLGCRWAESPSHTEFW